MHAKLREIVHPLWLAHNGMMYVPKDRDVLRVRMSDFAGRLEVQVMQTMVEDRAIEIMIHTSRQLLPRSMRVVISSLIHSVIQLLWVGTGIGLQ